MQRILTFVSAACVLLGAAGAHATPTTTTATQTITFGPGLTDFVNNSQNLNLFDSNLGTLQSVAIGGTYGFNSNLTITNSAANASSGSARTESAAGFSSGNNAINSVLDNTIDSVGPVTVGAITLNNAAIDALGTKSNYSLASGASTNATSTLGTKTLAPVTDTTAADLQAFETAGGGMFNVLFNTATGTVLSNSGGNTGANEVTTATGGLTITYTYTPAANPPPPPSVPEPASLALFGTALLGLGMLRRINR